MDWKSKEVSLFAVNQKGVGRKSIKDLGTMSFQFSMLRNQDCQNLNHINERSLNEGIYQSNEWYFLVFAHTECSELLTECQY